MEKAQQRRRKAKSKGATKKKKSVTPRLGLNDDHEGDMSMQQQRAGSNIDEFKGALRDLYHPYLESDKMIVPGELNVLK